MQYKPSVTRVLTRGMGVPFSFMETRGNKRPVATIIQKRATSWTIDKKVSNDFMAKAGKEVGVILSHKIPGEDHIVNLNSMGWYKKCTYRSEKEVIVQEGQYKTTVSKVGVDDSTDLEKLGLKLPAWVTWR